MIKSEPTAIRGIYPHLAWTNGKLEDPEWECGTGAVVPWAGKLWFITYPAHKPYGSEDKLYSLDEKFQVEAHPASVGGTHANRMIHKESEQLIIGPYFIDQEGKVRVVPPDQMEGRLTGVARHLTDPANKVIFYTMESGIYDVDVHSLQVTTHYRDPNYETNSKKRPHLLPGVHGKGAYTGQGRFVVSNNGLGGVLAEWTGEGDPGDRANWTIVDMNKYTEVTGPGGLYGAPDDTAPIWALGWDHKSVLLNVRDRGEWTRYRLPMASFTHIADHGWFTEWPRIRDIGQEKWLMDMFGMLFDFPPDFSTSRTAGIRPISVHHKMIVDYAEWNGQLVLGCNDATIQQNPLTGRCQSNVLFTSYEELRSFGQPHGWGSIWSKEHLEASHASEPFHFAGYEQRVLHVDHQSDHVLECLIELDVRGNGTWTKHETIQVPANGYTYHIFPEDLEAEWVRITPLQSVMNASASFAFGPSAGNPYQEELVEGLADAGSDVPRSEAILFTSNDMRLPLHVAGTVLDEQGQPVKTQMYELLEDLEFRPIKDEALQQQLEEELAPTRHYELDQASVIVTDENGARYRLPKGHEAFDQPAGIGLRRDIREVVTERRLMNVHGTFYELPYEQSGGVRGIQPISTHNKLIYDFCSWRGMLVLSGLKAKFLTETETVKKSSDNDFGLWFGNVDDLRSFGAPRGVGGPWLDTDVEAGVPSDPYLMAGYLNKRVELSHQYGETVPITIEVDVRADGNWVALTTVSVPRGETIEYTFPRGYRAHWVRLVAQKPTQATATFYYE